MFSKLQKVNKISSWLISGIGDTNQANCPLIIICWVLFPRDSTVDFED